MTAPGRLPGVLCAALAACALAAAAAVPARGGGGQAPAATAQASPRSDPAPASRPGARSSSRSRTRSKARRAAPSRAAALHAIAIAEDERRWSDGVLAGYLGHPDAEVRARAALAVGRLQDSTAVPALLPLLEDPVSPVREEAVFALGQIGHRSARPALEPLLDRGPDPLRALLIEALGKLGDRQATPKIAAFLGDSSPALRGEAAVALWRLADTTALEPLLQRHQDPDPEVRWRVLYALEKIASPDRIVLAAALHADDPEWLVRAYAARTIGREKAPRGTAYLVQMLEDKEPAVVVNAIRGLVLIADSTCAACLPGLVRALGHADPYVRVTAALALADRFAWVEPDTVTRSAAIDTLAARLADPDAATRGAAAKALIARVGADALAAVRPLLDDPSSYTRAAVLEALDQLPAARAAPLLMERARPGRPLLERMKAAEALGALKAAEALPPLRAGLADSSVLFAASAATALADMGDSASVPDLARAYATRLTGADADARVSIRDALRRLAGRAFADSVERVHPVTMDRKYAADFEQPSPVTGAVLHTTKGDVEWTFYRAEAVQTVKNFVALARRGYFDGLFVHRVVPNFVIQDGDPTGTGSGGPGYTIRCEYNHLRYDAGAVGMALSGKDTGGSQWFITHSPQPHLNGRYTIFAHVVRGMDVVGRIVQGDRILKVELK